MNINMFYPGYKLKEYLEPPNDIGKFYVQYILDISRTFITFRDGDIAIRYWSKDDDPLLNNYNEYEKIDLWNNISRTCNTDLFIAAAYINFNVGINSIYDAPNIISMADMPLKKILEKGIAETHLHTKAGISYQDIWKMKLSERKKSDINLWFCSFFRIIAARYVKDDVHQDFESYIYAEYKNDNIFGWTARFINGEAKLPDQTTLDQFNNLINNSKDQELKLNIDYLFSDVYADYKFRGTSADIILYYFIIKRLCDNYDPFLCKCFLTYVRFKNHFFDDKIQKTVFSGLDYFQKLYDSATKLNNSEYLRNQYYYSIFEEQCKTRNLDYLELKISPPVFKSFQTDDIDTDELMNKILRQIKGIIKAYSSYISMRMSDTEPCDSFRYPRLGIVYHFIKHEDSDNFSGYNCSPNDCSNQLDCSDYNTMRKKNISFLKALRQLMNKYPVLTDYIVGIDAASIENETEPWVFSPVFRAARQNSNTIPYSLEKNGKIQTLGFTYHVGEDFRHIISGLRHIDEVLDHFDYKSGDRLGHAIALGIDIDHYVSRSEMVSIPIMEHLENLLWMWQNTQNDNLAFAPENLDFKIMEVARRIYGENIDGINVYTLWRAYQAKFDDLDKYDLSNKCCDIVKKHHLIIEKSESWDFNDILYTFHCPCFYELYHRPIFVSANENVSFYKELQNKLIRKVEKMGIYVEANPSSNAVIGDIKSIMNHPILRLNSIQGENGTSVMTTINSDDPIIFSTNVENEIAYIYYSLLNANFSREKALEWIDKIRSHGVNSTFIKSRKNFKMMNEDLKTILDYD